MKDRCRLRFLIAFAGLLAAVPSPAQFVSFSRCRAAYPCAVPFGLQYRPDAILAGHYGSAGNGVMSVRVALRSTFPTEIDWSRRVDQDAVEAAVRAFVRRHPRLGRADREANPRNE